MTSDLFFETLQKQFSNELPFVAYRKPNSTKLKALIQNDNTLYRAKNFTETGFVFAPFDDTENALLIPQSNATQFEVDFDSLSNTETTPINNNDVISCKEKHINLVKKGIETINSGALKKVVLSRKEKLSLKEDNPIRIFKRLLNNYPSAFTYLWHHPNIGLWLGATPETLLKITGNQLKTMGLAGTQPYEGTTDVVWGTKEKEEQQMVTDSIVDSLQTLVNDIQVSETKTVKAGNLLHLKTQISATLNLETSSFKQLLRNLHPTPAICGLPRVDAKQFILENEAYNRSFYTGFLGELNIKETSTRNRNKRNVENSAYASIKTVTNLFVNLRCLQIIDAEAHIYVGGGITKDSIPESEWLETINKTNTMKKVL